MKKVPVFRVLLDAALTSIVLSTHCIQAYGVSRQIGPQIANRSEVVPATFGKTHFIVGAHRDYVPHVRTITSALDAKYCINEVFFSPDDDLQQKLVSYIKQEHEAIFLAIFSFTDKTIAQELINARKRGINIEIISDPGFLSDRYTKVHILQDAGIPVYIYDPKKAKKPQSTISHRMHNKFVIFKRNMYDKPLVWTGSFNFTKSARLSNRENVVVLNHPEIVEKFIRQFATLKDETIKYDQTK